MYFNKRAGIFHNGIQQFNEYFLLKDYNAWIGHGFFKHISPQLVNMATDQTRQDPFQRLSLAVRELDKLIHRANQLAHLSQQPLPSDQPDQSEQTSPPQHT